jgi:hypothetical protein
LIINEQDIEIQTSKDKIKEFEKNLLALKEESQNQTTLLNKTNMDSVK